MLADAGGEDERVEPTERRRHRSDRLGDPVRVEIEGERRCVRRVTHESRNVVGSCEPHETRLVLERMVELVEVTP